MGYIFDPDVLHEIARMGVGLPHDQMFQVVAEELDKRYPGRLRKHRRWIFNVAGGAMGSLTILYASLSEYLIFFGTAIGTEGYSGRYWADVYDVMMDGEMWCYTPGQFEPVVYKPGDMSHLKWREEKGYRAMERSWMLEYSRGWIPLMLPFGVLGSLLQTLDFRSMGRQFRDYGGTCIKELLRGKI